MAVSLFPLRRTLSTTFFTLCLTLGLQAWAEKLGTGLLPPSADEAAWLANHATSIELVRPNATAVARLSAERRARGLVQPTIALETIAKPGEEYLSFAAMDLSQNLTSLPSAIDNSTSPAFPPIGHQGGQGSCGSWTAGYYAYTYEYNLARGFTASNGNPNYIFSPKWAYNQANGGVDAGTSLAGNFRVFIDRGAATMAEVPYDENFTEWSSNPNIWRSALARRAFNQVGVFGGSDLSDEMLQNIKTHLANGHVASVATIISEWVYGVVSDDPATAEDNMYVGQKILSYVKKNPNFGHAMTFVGYNDNLWIDSNHNGVVDPHEKGAFKIANQYGTEWGNAGYIWASYDALRNVTRIPSTGSWPAADRGPFNGGLSLSFYFPLVHKAYNPELVVKVRLATATRNGVRLDLGVTGPDRTYWTDQTHELSFIGGPLGLFGGNAEQQGDIYFDATDLLALSPQLNRWVLKAKNSSNSPLTISGFSIYQSTSSGDQLRAAYSGSPLTINKDQEFEIPLEWNFSSDNAAPVALLTISPTNGAAGTTVRMDASSSYDPDGEVLAYQYSLCGEIQWPIQNQASVRDFVFGNWKRLPAGTECDAVITAVDNRGHISKTSRTFLVGGALATPEPQPTPSRFGTPTPTPQLTSTPIATATPRPQLTPTRVATATATPRSTATPRRTPAVRPTATPRPQRRVPRKIYLSTRVTSKGVASINVSASPRVGSYANCNLTMRIAETRDFADATSFVFPLAGARLRKSVPVPLVAKRTSLQDGRVYLDGEYSCPDLGGWSTVRTAIKTLSIRSIRKVPLTDESSWIAAFVDAMKP